MNTAFFFCFWVLIMKHCVPDKGKEYRANMKLPAMCDITIVTPRNSFVCVCVCVLVIPIRWDWPIIWLHSILLVLVIHQYGLDQSFWRRNLIIKQSNLNITVEDMSIYRLGLKAPVYAVRKVRFSGGGLFWWVVENGGVVVTVRQAVITLTSQF